MPVIMVVEDDETILETLERVLEREGHDVLGVLNSYEVLTVARESQPDLIILDMVLPGDNGLSLCTQLRKLPHLTDIPILFLTAYHSAHEIALALDAGGDDFMRKPFSTRELNARIRALLRRANRNKKEDVQHLMIDYNLRTVSVDQRVISLTPVEFDLLDFLCDYTDKYHTANDLLEKVWDYPSGSGDTALVRNHIHNLRNKLEYDPDRPRIIVSLHGRGYRINANISKTGRQREVVV
ncbi:MAG: response regulator transcription factor [Chloroflexi bacterium]|nr:response regulator transcription factor [Chloroflexota bacterium]